MPDKFRVTVTKGLWQDQWPAYFDKFYHYCNNIVTIVIAHNTIITNIRPINNLSIRLYLGLYFGTHLKSDSQLHI